MEVRQFSFWSRCSFMKSRMPATSTSGAGWGATAAAVGAGAGVGAAASGAGAAGVASFFLKTPPRILPRMLIRLLLMRDEAVSANEAQPGSVKLARRGRMRGGDTRTNALKQRGSASRAI